MKKSLWLILTIAWTSTLFSQIGIPKTIQYQTDTLKCFDIPTTKRIVKDLIRLDSSEQISKIKDQQLLLDSLRISHLDSMVTTYEFNSLVQENIINEKNLKLIDANINCDIRSEQYERKIKKLTFKNKVLTYVSTTILGGLIFNMFLK